jgi:hypothetical protein
MGDIDAKLKVLWIGRNSLGRKIVLHDDYLELQQQIKELEVDRDDLINVHKTSDENRSKCMKENIKLKTEKKRLLNLIDKARLELRYGCTDKYARMAEIYLSEALIEYENSRSVTCDKCGQSTFDEDYWKSKTNLAEQAIKEKG